MMKFFRRVKRLFYTIPLLSVMFLLAMMIEMKIFNPQANNLRMDSIDMKNIPWIYAVTPTFWRYAQKADLTRLSQTLQHVKKFHWIVVEDSNEKTPLVTRFLMNSEISYTHLNVRTSDDLQRKTNETYRTRHRGLEQRNLGLKWLRKNIDLQNDPGVVYFMDDDNTYHKGIFEQMRWTKKVSVWPVGLSAKSLWEGPIVKNGKVVKFHTNWARDRTFPIDMAAFAVNLNVFIKQKPDAEFDLKAQRGYVEPTFLKSITTKEELEPLASNCSEVLVWHTNTQGVKYAINGNNHEQVKEV